MHGAHKRRKEDAKKESNRHKTKTENEKTIK